MLLHRQFSVRAHDGIALMVGAAVTQGDELEHALTNLLEDDSVAYVHIHNAGPGCYNCSVERV